MPADRDVVAASRAGTLLLLGNTAVVECFRERGSNDLKRRKCKHLRNQVTEVHFPQGTSLVEAVKNVVDLWPWHSDADGPEWVQSDDPILERAIAEHFTTSDHECVIGRPDGWNIG